jgi:hypothetical protein
LLGAAPLLLAIALISPCHADSSLQAASATGGPLTASAHLDFRVTVLPSLALAARGSTVLIQGNSGVLTLQRSETENSDGMAPSASTQLLPRHQVIDTSMQASAFAGTKLLTVASP